ncbi:hypothetical protein NBRC10512_006440 [Rhodotorula toruloides]|uniref:RHTO0S03e12486g1_1 n=2 Tax=Rhodotorula toruloides TaxID=5286 RepID=A0A061AM85_RHOTO|nr:uncharacterized protein RHTO_00586 [Rhodotorula toruloides NP11]EMS26158.1 hypothetical protein RHTO_00586 [Rhodotorula toruloides NP11]KAJ8295723.1 hypothetical protein OF846_001083 [Rhodotorula toruloides]CDR38714.1 RHTO0S03e12486g1_1 [Rhodotorula toruloides]
MSGTSNKPLQLDYARNTYFTLSTASAIPPTLPTLPSPDSFAISSGPRLEYVGPVGPGSMADEHVVAVEGIATGTSEVTEIEAVEEAKRLLKAVQGVKRVEMMQPTMRSKR